MNKNYHLQSAVLSVAAAAFSMATAVVMKLHGDQIHIFQMIMVRSLVIFTLTAPLFQKNMNKKIFNMPHFSLNLGRAVAAFVAMSIYYYAVQRVDLAVVSVITFAKPLFTVVVAVLFLNEVLKIRRLVATLIGFLGVLIIIRPGYHGFHTDELMVLIIPVLLSFAMVLTKKLTRSKASNRAILFHNSWLMFLFSLPLAIFYWQDLPASLWAVMAGSCVFAYGAEWCRVHALRHADATEIMPYQYMHVIFSGLIGYIWFAEKVDQWDVMGASIILGSGFYLAIREKQLKKKQARLTMLDNTP